MSTNLAVIIPVFRKPSLRQVLEHYATVAEVDEIVVIDFDYAFSCTQHTYVGLSDSDLLRIVSVEGERYFNKPKALNVGVHLCSSRQALCCDADVLIPPSILRFMSRVLGLDACSIVTIKNVRETETGELRTGYGQCAFSRELFMIVQGYCSEFDGWGAEDNEFIHRLCLVGAIRHDCGQADHISHPESERIQGYRGTSRREMQLANRRLLSERMDAGITLGTLEKDVAETVFREV